MPDRSPTTPSAVLRRAGLVGVLTVLAVGAGSLVLDGFSSAPLLRLAQGLALFGLGAVVVIGAVGLVAVRLGGWHEPEADFEALVQRSERLARWPEPDADTFEFGVPEDDLGLDDDDDDVDDGVAELELAGPDAGFDALVRAAVEELPIEFHRALEHVAIIISDSGAVALRGPDGRPRGAYGMYQGDTVAHDFFTERILIFRDTLLRDFGHDPELLAAQVRRVVRHELAHHLGWGERGVRNLGL